MANDASTISSNFSAVVELALKDYIQNQRAKKAIESYGSWSHRNEKSEDIVRSMRSQDNRDFSKDKKVRRKQC